MERDHGEGNMGGESRRVWHGGIVEEEPWRSDHGGRPMEASWMRNRGEGRNHRVLERNPGGDKSLRRFQARGIQDEEALRGNQAIAVLRQESGKGQEQRSQERNHVLEETPRRHPETPKRHPVDTTSTRETPKRHPRGSQGHPGGTQETPRRCQAYEQRIC